MSCFSRKRTADLAKSSPVLLFHTQGGSAGLGNVESRGELCHCSGAERARDGVLWKCVLDTLESTNVPETHFPRTAPPAALTPAPICVTIPQWTGSAIRGPRGDMALPDRS